MWDSNTNKWNWLLKAESAISDIFYSKICLIRNDSTQFPQKYKYLYHNHNLQLSLPSKLKINSLERQK